MDPNSLEPPTDTARMFLHRMLWFGVGVGLGLSPFLGAVDHPVFKPLLNVMPLQVRFELISLSAFLFGMVAVAVDFYAAERVSLRTLRKAFGGSFVILIVGFFLFVFLRQEFTVSVPRGDTKVTVLYGPSPTRDCLRRCDNPVDDPVGCIKDLGFDEVAIARCWGRKALNRRSQLLGIAYLVLTGGLGCLVGIVVLQTVERRRQEKERGAGPRPGRRRRRRSNLSAATERTPPEPADIGASPRRGERPTPGVQ